MRFLLEELPRLPVSPSSATIRTASETLFCTGTGDGVVEIGRAMLTVHPEGGAAAEIEVKYVVYWREEDGVWKWHRHLESKLLTAWSAALLL